MISKASENLRWHRVLVADTKLRRLVSINRGRQFGKDIRGILLDCSSDLVLLHVVDDSFFLDGFLILPTRDIKKYRPLRDWNRIAARVLKLRDLVPATHLKIDLTDMRSAIVSAGRLFPLLTIHREFIDDTVCYIGKANEMRQKTFVMRTIDPAAKWDDNRRFRFEDITKLEFGDAYESALWLANCSLRHDERQLRAAERYDRGIRGLRKLSRS